MQGKAKEKSSSADNKDFLQNEPYSAAEGMYYVLLQCLLLEFVGEDSHRNLIGLHMQ